MRAFVKRNAAVLPWLSGLGIPLAIAFSGWFVSTGIENSKLSTEYVRIALSVLTASGKEKCEHDSPCAFTQEEQALRKWAVRLLNDRSPEKFSAEEQAAIVHLPMPFGVGRNLEFESPVGPMEIFIQNPIKERKLDDKAIIEFKFGNEF